MRRVRYSVAASLDGYIAGPKGEADWIITDPDIDFNAIFAQFDTFLIGRRTYEAMAAMGQTETPGTRSLVFSRNWKQKDHPGVTLVTKDEKKVVNALKAESGKDIWLFGGGELFRSLAEAGVVDTVEVAVIPVMLGQGIALLPSPAPQIKLTLTRHKVFPKSGIVMLEYSVKARRRQRPAG